MPKYVILADHSPEVVGQRNEAASGGFVHAIDLHLVEPVAGSSALLVIHHP